MASSKVMMLRAKAAKKAKANPEGFRIDEEKFLQSLLIVSELLIADNPNQDYAETENSLWAAKEMILKHKLNSTDLKQMLKFRETFEQALKKGYGVELATGLMAFAQDQEQCLKLAQVPQKVRTTSGFLDTLIAVLSFKTEHIKFINMSLA